MFSFGNNEGVRYEVFYCMDIRGAGGITGTSVDR